MATSDDETFLANLITARTVISAALAEGIPVVEYYISNRRVRREATMETLTEIENLIERTESRIGSATSGRAYNNARLKRRG